MKLKVIEGSKVIIGRETFEAGAMIPDQLIELFGGKIPGTERVEDERPKRKVELKEATEK